MYQLIKFRADYGRMGDIEAVFISTKESMKTLKGKTIYFGEILGKHSDIDYEFDAKDFKVISEDQEFIGNLKSIFGNSETIIGYNPFDYIDEDEEE
jgi:hypothetical protein